MSRASARSVNACRNVSSTEPEMPLPTGSRRIPMVDDLRVRRRRAEACGRYPSSVIAIRTRSCVEPATMCGVFSTLDTVCRETPARRATSSTVGNAIDASFGGLTSNES